MKKFILLALVAISAIIFTGSTTTYHITVSHIYEHNGQEISRVVTLDERAPAGTEYTVQTIESPTLTGFEDGVWELGWGVIEGGNSTLEENYHDITLLPLQSTTFNLIPDDTYVEYHYVFTPNLHVKYQWTDAPDSATLPIDEKGYRNGYIYRDKITLDKTYKQGSTIEENDKIYTFSGWKVDHIADNIVYLIGSWTAEDKPHEEEPPVVEPDKPEEKEEFVPEPPHTDIDI